MEIACKMAVGFLSKQSPETKTPQFLQSVSLIAYHSDCNQFCDWWIWWRAVKMIGLCTGVQLSQLPDYTVQLQLCL